MRGSVAVATVLLAPLVLGVALPQSDTASIDATGVGCEMNGECEVCTEQAGCAWCHGASLCMRAVPDTPADMSWRTRVCSDVVSTAQQCALPVQQGDGAADHDHDHDHDHDKDGDSEDDVGGGVAPNDHPAHDEQALVGVAVAQDAPQAEQVDQPLPAMIEPTPTPPPQRADEGLSLSVVVNEQEGQCLVTLSVSPAHDNARYSFSLSVPHSRVPVFLADTSASSVSLLLPQLCQPCVVSADRGEYRFAVRALGAPDSPSATAARTVHQCDSQRAQQRCTALTSCTASTCFPFASSLPAPMLPASPTLPPELLGCSTGSLVQSDANSALAAPHHALCALLTVSEIVHSVEAYGELSECVNGQETSAALSSALGPAALEQWHDDVVDQYTEWLVGIVGRLAVTRLVDASLVQRATAVRMVLVSFAGISPMPRSVSATVFHDVAASLLERITTALDPFQTSHVGQSDDQPIASTVLASSSTTAQAVVDGFSAVLLFANALWEEVLCHGAQVMSEEEFNAQVPSTPSQVPGAQVLLQESLSNADGDDPIQRAVELSVQVSDLLSSVGASERAVPSNESPLPIAPLRVLHSLTDHVLRSSTQLAKAATALQSAGDPGHATHLVSPAILLTGTPLDEGLQSNATVVMSLEGGAVASAQSLPRPLPSATVTVPADLNVAGGFAVFAMLRSRQGGCCGEVMGPVFRVMLYDADGTPPPPSTVIRSVIDAPVAYLSQHRFADLAEDAPGCARMDGHGAWGRSGSGSWESTPLPAFRCVDEVGFAQTVSGRCNEVVAIEPTPSSEPEATASASPVVTNGGGDGRQVGEASESPVAAESTAPVASASAAPQVDGEEDDTDGGDKEDDPHDVSNEDDGGDPLLGVGLGVAGTVVGVVAGAAFLAVVLGPGKKLRRETLM